MDFRKYRIQGATNPIFASRAIAVEPRIGAMLPCNVIVKEHAEYSVEVSTVDPVASMLAIKNDQLGSMALEVQQKLKNVIDQL